MTAAELTLIDDQVLVACTVDEAMQLLDGPDPIAAWFRATRNETTTTITSAEGDCVNRPGFCIRSSQSLEGSRDASKEGIHA